MNPICHFSWADDLSDLNSLLGSADGVLLIGPENKTIFSWNPDQAFVPASTLKILTALVALHHLGPDYRFPTEFYLDKSSNLIIKGYGDPMLTSEVVVEIIDQMYFTYLANVTGINDIIIDSSFFQQPLTIPGITSSFEPYDAPNGALCVNFNTVNFTQNGSGKYISAEAQTPLLPYVLDRIKVSGLKTGRIVLSNRSQETAIYAGHMFKFFFAKKGIEIKGQIKTGKINTNTAMPLYRYASRYTLANLISRLMEFSNNFMANQILIATGAKLYGAPGTLSAGVRAISTYAETTLGIKDIELVEGSGISRKNRISPRTMARILAAFEPYRRLLQQTGQIFCKTGTLNGIRTRAGYIETTSGKLYRFAIFINTPGGAIEKIMDKILRIATL